MQSGVQCTASLPEIEVELCEVKTALECSAVWNWWTDANMGQELVVFIRSWQKTGYLVNIFQIR